MLSADALPRLAQSQHIACIGEETSSKNDYRCRSCTERSNAQYTRFHPLA